MSIGNTLKHVLGFVAGILIPGASEKIAQLTHSVQQELANLYGQAAEALAKELAVDETGMSGPDKIFAITKALVATAKADGFKGDLKVLEHVALDVAQTAFRAALPDNAADIVALAASFASNPIEKATSALIFDRSKTDEVSEALPDAA